ncbi:MAG: ATP-grasp domain-containing protein [Firmicutes bacterium]|nr:ATP-grasp domain-containing protein [Bacillota bacterium]
MRNLKNKRLLISGEPDLIYDVVKKANEMGVYTILTGDYKDSPAKEIADESHQVSTANTDRMVAFAREKHADGVLTQYIDSDLPNVQKVCKRLNLPFIATAEQLELIGNKKNAKDLFIEHGIPVPKEFNITEELRDSDLDKVVYPVLTKPVDNSWQRGISICKNRKELITGYRKALEFSESGNVLVEEYLEGDYVVLNFTLQDGFLSLSALADKPVMENNNSSESIRLPKGYILPSKYIDLFYDTLYSRFKDMFHTIGLKNGSVGVEAVVKDDIFYAFEMQCRLGGMRHHQFVFEETGMDILKMHINYALTGRFAGWDVRTFDNPRFRKVHCLLNLLSNPGTISKIEVPKNITSIPGIISYLPMHEVGDKIEQTGTVSEVFGKVALAADNENRLIESIEKVHNELRVLDENGSEMLLKTMTLDDLTS